jgi:hypothetical protein
MVRVSTCLFGHQASMQKKVAVRDSLHRLKLAFPSQEPPYPTDIKTSK